MPSHEDIEAEVLNALSGEDFSSEEATKKIRNLRTLVECRPRVEPLLPEPVVEEPPQNWIERHSDTLIKSGFSLLGVVVIVAGEKLGGYIFNTKAWNSIPK